jgi:uncharacterized protein
MSGEMWRSIGIRGSVVVCLVVALVPCWAQQAGSQGAAQSSPVAKYKVQGCVNDFAGMIDGKVKGEIEAVCKELDEKKKTQMAIVTVESLEGMSIQEFATEMFSEWKMGDKDTNQGVLVLLSRGDRKWRITVGYKLESVLTEEEAEKLRNGVTPMLKNGEYGEALLQVAKEIREEVLQKVK